MNRTPLVVSLALASAAIVSFTACSKKEGARRDDAPAASAAPAAAAPQSAAVPAASAVAMRLGFGVTCSADSECATGTCFRKGANGGGGGADNGEGSGGGNGGGGTPAKGAAGHPGGSASAADAERATGYCSMPCNGNSDCPTPLTAGKCNGRGFCKKG